MFFFSVILTTFKLFPFYTNQSLILTL